MFKSNQEEAMVGPAYINELEQNLLRNKHAKYSHILCT